MKNTVAILLVAALICGAVSYADLITVQGAKPEDAYQILKDLVYAVNNKNLTDANLAANTAYAAIASATTVVCDGERVSISATNTITMEGVALAASEKCIFLVGVDSAGAFSVAQGNIADYAYQLKTPMFDSGIAPLGTIKVECGTDGAYTPGTTSLAAASNTYTFTDLYSLPVSLDVNPR